MCKTAQVGQGLHSRCGSCGDDGLQGTEAVGFAAVVGFGGDGGQHSGQVFWRRAGQADQAEVGFGQGGVGGAACCDLLNGVGNARQVVDLGHGVDTGRLLASHDVAQQGEVVSIGGGSANVSANQSVLLGSGVGRGGCGVVARCAIHVVGLRQDDVVGVDDGLHFGRGVCALSVVGVAQRGVWAFLAVDGVVDGAQVAGCHTGHTGSQVIGIGRCCCARFGKVSDLVNRSALRRGGGRDQGLQLAQAVGFAAVVVLGGDGRQHGRQVVHGDAGQAERGKVNCAERRRGCACVRHTLNGVGDAGEFVDLGDGVHIGGGFAAHDVIEQGQVLGIGRGGADVGTHAGVLRSHGVGRAAVVGFGQDGVVSLDDGLHLGRGVGCSPIDGGAGQGVVDGIEVGS